MIGTKHSVETEEEYRIIEHDDLIEEQDFIEKHDAEEE